MNLFQGIFKLFIISAFGILSCIAIDRFLLLENVLPSYWLKDSGFTLSFNLLIISMGPFIAMSLVSLFYKLFGIKEPFLESNSIAMQDTLEQTIVFTVNVYAAGSLNGIEKNLIKLTICFIVGRIIFWFGSIISKYNNHYEFKLLGFFLTLISTLELVCCNLKGKNQGFTLWVSSLY